MIVNKQNSNLINSNSNEVWSSYNENIKSNSNDVTPYYFRLLSNISTDFMLVYCP